MSSPRRAVPTRNAAPPEAKDPILQRNEEERWLAKRKDAVVPSSPTARIVGGESVRNMRRIAGVVATFSVSVARDPGLTALFIRCVTIT